MHEGLLKIVNARGSGVPDLPTSNVDGSFVRTLGIGVDLKVFVGVQAVFEGSQGHDGFKNRAGRIILEGGPVFFRGRTLYLSPLIGADALGEGVGVKSG